MQSTTVAHPNVVSQSEWLIERKALLAEEKELTKQRDRVNAQRRRLPMVQLDKAYVFESPNGTTTLLDLFEGCRQRQEDFEDSPSGCPPKTTYS